MALASQTPSSGNPKASETADETVAADETVDFDGKAAAAVVDD